MTSDAAITAAFPYPVLSVVSTRTTDPSFATLALLQEEINANARSIASTEGGRFGLLTLTLAPDKYLERTSNVSFVVPVHMPHVNPTDGPTAIQITVYNERVKAMPREYNRYYAADRILCNLVMAATDEVHYMSLKHPDWYYEEMSCLQLLTHLRTTYGTIKYADIIANDEMMSTPWSPPSKIMELFSRLDKGAVFAAAAGVPMSDRQLTFLAYRIVQASGMLADRCEQWRDKETAEQTYAAFKAHFR